MRIEKLNVQSGLRACVQGFKGPMSSFFMFSGASTALKLCIIIFNITNRFKTTTTTTIMTIRLIKLSLTGHHYFNLNVLFIFIYLLLLAPPSFFISSIFCLCLKIEQSVVFMVTSTTHLLSPIQVFKC